MENFRMDLLVKKSLNFVANHIMAGLGMSTLLVFYAYEITFTSVLFYALAAIGFVSVLVFLSFILTATLTKSIADENEKLKKLVSRLQNEIDRYGLTCSQLREELKNQLVNEKLVNEKLVNEKRVNEEKVTPSEIDAKRTVEEMNPKQEQVSNEQELIRNDY